MLTIDQSFDGASVNLSVGQVLELRLPENPTTGFVWNFESKGDPGCAVIDNRFVASGVRPGSGGEHTWHIRGLKAGVCRISLVYRRPWEVAALPAHKFQITIDVTR